MLVGVVGLFESQERFEMFRENQAGQHSASRETALTEPTPQDATAKDGQRE